LRIEQSTIKVYSNNFMRHVKSSSCMIVPIIADFKFNGSDLCYNEFPMVEADGCNEQLNLVGLFISK
jgi:hypothetical protein